LAFLAISNGSRQQSGPARADALHPVSISPFYFYSDSYEDVIMPITTKLKAVSLGVSLALAGLLVGCNQNDSDPLVKDDAYYRGQAEAMVAKLTLGEKLDLLSGPGYGSANGAINVNVYVVG